MAKKHKSRHRVPPAALELKSDPVDERYQVEIQMSTSRLERAYRKAQKALASAEAKAERVRRMLATAQERARQKEIELAVERLRQQKAAEQARLNLEQVKDAAKRQRQAIARQQQIEAWERVRRAQQAAERRRQAALDRAHRNAIDESRRRQQEYDRQLLVVEDRRQELHAIEMLMIPSDYNGRDSRRRLARHEAGEIIIPLGDTTGIRKKPPRTPVFPVTTRRA